MTFHDDLEVHYVILTGAADAFSSGSDLKHAASGRTEEMTDLDRWRRFYTGVRLCRAWEEMPQITSAVIERMAVGAGCGLDSV